MAVASLDHLAGLVLDGRYRLVTRVGEGGFGVVYRGEVAGSPMPVAVKLLRLPDEATDAERATLLQKFDHEAAVLRRLRHPNIASALDGGLVTLGGVRTAYLVLEWCEGSTLRDALAASRGRRRSAREAWRLLRPVCEAAAHAHSQGVVHRDLKPANVMLVPRADGALTARVIDFGIAKAMSPEASVGTGDTMTTRGPSRRLMRPPSRWSGCAAARGPTCTRSCWSSCWPAGLPTTRAKSASRSSRPRGPHPRRSASTSARGRPCSQMPSRCSRAIASRTPRRC